MGKANTRLTQIPPSPPEMLTIPPGTVRFFDLGSRVTAAVAKAVPRRPGLSIGGRRGHKTSRTQHSCGLWRPGPARPGGCAGVSALVGPDTHSFPAPWPFEERRAHLPGEGPVRPGSRSGRVVRRLLLYSRGGAPVGVGWILGGCFGTEPVFWGQLRAEPVHPPTHLRSVVQAPRIKSKRARPASHQSGRLPGLRPRTPDRTRGPLTTGCHRCGWPRRLPLGVGSPAVPWL